MAMQEGFRCGMGIGGWLTNYKRILVLPPARRHILTTGDFEHFQTYITQWDIDNIADMGMDHIRLAFDQVVMENADRPGEYREECLRHLDNAIGWCKSAGLKVMLNLHKAIGCYCDCPDENNLLTDEGLWNRFIDFWVMLEKRYAGEGHVAFELMNEINTYNSEGWNRLAAKTITALQKLNPNRLIVLGSANFGDPALLKDLILFDDPHIAYTFHMYSPFEFTHQRGVLQHEPAFYNRQMRYPDSLDRYYDYRKTLGKAADDLDGLQRMDIAYMQRMMQPACDFVRQHPDKILYFGEFGTIRHCDIRSRENWMQDVISIAREASIPYSVWNYLSTPYDGNRFSLVDDETRQILSPRLLQIIQGRI